MEIPQRLLSLICVALFASSLAAAERALDDDPAPTEAGATASLDDCMPEFSARIAGCEGGCSACSCAACQKQAPWTLPQPCALQKMGIKVGGWLEQGITLNPDNPSDHFNGPVATNDWDDEYQMNQLWLFLDRPADTGGCGFAVGGHIDLIYGSDWRFGINNGLENRINGFDYQRYGLVIPQMYMEVAYNNLSVKLGHFAGILDYEAVPCRPQPVLLAFVFLRIHGSAIGHRSVGRIQTGRSARSASRLPSWLVDVRGYQSHAGCDERGEVDQCQPAHQDRLGLFHGAGRSARRLRQCAGRSESIRIQPGCAAEDRQEVAVCGRAQSRLASATRRRWAIRRIGTV